MAIQDKELDAIFNDTLGKVPVTSVAQPGSTPVTGGISQTQLDLIFQDSMRTASTNTPDNDETTLPPRFKNIQERISFEQANRPDLLAEGTKTLSDPTIYERGKEDPGKYMAGFGKTAMGVFQRGVSAIANPLLEDLREKKKPGESVRDFQDRTSLARRAAMARGLKGTQLGEAQDLYMEIGLPKPAAFVAGLVTEAVVDPASRAAKIVGGVLGQGARRLAVWGAKGTKEFTLKNLLHLDARRIDRLMGNGFQDVTKESMQGGLNHAQKVANDIYAQERRAHSIASAEWDKVIDSVPNKPIRNESALRIAGKIEDVTSGEIDPGMVDAIMNMPVSRSKVVVAAVAAKPVAKTTVKSEKAVTYFNKKKVGVGDEAEFVDVKDVTKGASVEQAGFKTGEATTKRQVGEFNPIPTKKVVTKTLKKVEGAPAAATPTGKAVTRTYEDLVNDVLAGKPTSSGEWIMLIRNMRKMSKTNPAAAEIVDAIGEDIAKEVPGLEAAVRKWRAYSTIAKSRNTLIGRIDKGYVPINAENLQRYYDEGIKGPMWKAVRDLDSAFEDISYNVYGIKEHDFPKYLDLVRQISAVAPLAKPGVKISGLSASGLLGIALTRLGIPAPIIGIAGGTILAESVPRLSAKTGRAVFNPDSPAYKALQNIGVATEAAGKLGGISALRAVRGQDPALELLGGTQTREQE